MDPIELISFVMNSPFQDSRLLRIPGYCGILYGNIFPPSPEPV